MKKAMKIIGKILGGYLILNTLVWAGVGTGRYCNDYFNERTRKRSENVTSGYANAVLMDNFGDAEEGFKAWINGIKELL